MTKNIRNITVFFALIAVIVIMISIWAPQGMGFAGQMEEYAVPIAGLLVALGIFADTGKEPMPLTKENLLEKLKSPVVWSATFTLIAFILYRVMVPTTVDLLLNTINTLIVAMFGVSVWNNPNARETLT